MKNLSTEELIRCFVARLHDREHDVRRVASFWNSFEHWLKFELALALCETWERRPWTDQSDAGTLDTVGLEYKVPLTGDPSRREIEARTKQVDLWTCSSTGERWHYVELKVMFNNANRSKQLESWKSDHALLQQIDDARVDGRLALLVAVGFSEHELRAIGGRLEAHLEPTGRGRHATPSIAVLSLA